MSHWRNRRSTWVNVVTLVIFFVFLFPSTGEAARGGYPLNDPADQANQLLEKLTPEERVGQLFLVTFQGSSFGPDLPIYDLIHNHHIGGVVLLSRMDNIVPLNGDSKTIPEQVQNLITVLQQSEWDSSAQSQINPSSGLSYLPNYIPLLIGIPQEGDGYPYDQILRGLTDLPSQMAIGATWNPELAEQVGTVMGNELSSLGFNLLLGPSLDVLDLPQIEITNNLGIRTFGGDPYWVGEMGRAFIRGIHLGSNSKMAVAAKHFPGYGGSDRLPEEEVATVRKSLDELKSIDLAPFISVTGNALTPEETSDALLSSHIRYQGLQGNIRSTTRPVSLDPQALGLLTTLPGLANWRENDGVLISDDLGNMAIRRFYDLTNQAFDPRRVTLNAFLAGNDILYVADFSTSNDPDSYSEALRTLDFFAQKYREDAAFAQRVDESVRRILTLKFRLFTDFNLENLLPITGALKDVGQSSSVTFDVARSAATLLSPSQVELDTTIPDPPNQNDRIVFIVDTRTGQQCNTCNPYPILSKQAMQDAVVRLYGPQAGGLISMNNLSSFSFEDLLTLLDSKSEAPELERDLSRAHWIVMVATSDLGRTSSFEVLKRFLAERPDLFQQKRLIVFSMTAPYYLDATNISKLTAYYALYSKTPPFVDTAAYLLFGELRATGSPPVSVPGIGYNLNEALFPNPDLTIPLIFDIPTSQQVITGTTTPEPQPPPEFRVGDVIPLLAGEIFDHNGNPVPDGTPVNFIFSYGGETTGVRQIAYTQNGMARTTYAVTNSGMLEIGAESENARANPIRLDIPSPSGELITASPSPEPTETQILPAPTQTQQIIVPPTIEPPTRDQPGLGEWIISVLLALGISFGIYLFASQMGNNRWGIRAGLLALTGGLISYTYLAIRLPGSQIFLGFPLPWNMLLASLGGILTGLIISLVWMALAGSFRFRKPDKG
jgi:beta-N-acetylhexosaminidase